MDDLAFEGEGSLARRQAVHRVILANPRSQRPWVIAKLAGVTHRQCQAALRDLAAAGAAVREVRRQSVFYRAR